MSKRKLRRQLNLVQVIMLGTAGTLAAEIFVLTGHAAGISGPVAVLALLIGGLLSYSVALNYCELATTYPVAGGAMSYVREGFGTGLLSYLVGSMDCLSSTFYAALSAVGFAYSLQVFFPALPIVPTAAAVISLFVVLNILGVTKTGNLQIVLGSILLLVFVIFIAAGLLLPSGFHWDVFISGKVIFAGKGFWSGLSITMATISLVYTAYVGFEVIADDAEEVMQPNRNIPISILVSLTLCTLIYVLVALVTLGTVPWTKLAGSETALTDAVRRYLPAFGVPMMAVAGMIATLTSINTAMLSATREAFTLSRDGVWPAVLSRLSRYRTPVFSIITIGGISVLVAIIGLVDFLSYISSVGYLFVLFWGSLSMIRLRKRYPDLERPFKVPLFPLTAYGAAASCLLIVVFAKWQALLFGAGVIVFLIVLYRIVPRVAKLFPAREPVRDNHQDLILVAAGNPDTASRLVHVATLLAQASEDSYICLLSVERPETNTGVFKQRLGSRRLGSQSRKMLDQVAELGRACNVALYAKSRTASSVADGILDEVAERENVKLVLTGWPGTLNGRALADNPVKLVIQRSHTNVVALLDRGLSGIRHILVPIGGGPHSRLALRLAYEIAIVEGARISALRVVLDTAEQEELEDQALLLEEIAAEVLHGVPDFVTLLVRPAVSLPEGILAESTRQPFAYDLICIGATEEWAWHSRLFGSVVDWIGDEVSCSVLFCRQYEPVPISWIRRQVKIADGEYKHARDPYAPTG